WLGGEYLLSRLIGDSLLQPSQTRAGLMVWLMAYIMFPFYICKITSYTIAGLLNQIYRSPEPQPGTVISIGCLLSRCARCVPICCSQILPTWAKCYCLKVPLMDHPCDFATSAHFPYSSNA